MTTALTYDFQDHDRGKRLDVVLAREFPSLSRTRVKGLIATGKLLIDGVVVEFPAYKIKGKEENSCMNSVFVYCTMKGFWMLRPIAHLRLGKLVISSHKHDNAAS